MQKKITGLPTGYMKMSYDESQKIPQAENCTHINAIIRNCKTKKLLVIDTDSQDSYDYLIKHPAFIPTAYIVTGIWE